MERDDFRFFLKKLEVLSSFSETESLQYFRGLFTEIERKSVKKFQMLEVEMEDIDRSLERMRREGEEEKRGIEEEERRVEELETGSKRRN